MLLCFFEQIKAALVKIRDLFLKALYIFQTSNFWTDVYINGSSQ